MNQEYYDKCLEFAQQEHLKQVSKTTIYPWRPCFHDHCPECIGTGIKHDGTPCVHSISCPCPKCSPSY